MTFRKLRTTALQLLKLQDDETGEYYRIVERFKNELSEFLLDDEALTNLNKTQLIRLIGWCSNHRPMPLHVLMIYFSQIKPKKRKS